MIRFASFGRLLVVTVVVLTASHARAETPLCQLGAELRWALGFGPQELAAMGVGATAHQAMADLSESFCTANAQTIEPLLDDVRSARKAAFKAYETGESIATADLSLIDAINTLAGQCSTVLADLRGELTDTQQALHDRFAANRLLDPRLCFLELTDQQRSDLRETQRTRDKVLRHCIDRSSLSKVRMAHEAFEDAVIEILNEGQETDMAAISQNLNDTLTTVLTTEEGLCGS